jgi:ParB-like chromosome segregation protein Spo0J
MLETLSVDEMLAQFKRVRGLAATGATDRTPTAPAEHMPEPLIEQSLAGINLLPLTQLTLSMRQPRRGLPDDLRRAFGRGECSAADTMAVLVTRAAESDTEAQGHLSSLRPLADSIARIGIEHPILVIATNKDAVPRYEIKDGERRFWACVLLDGDGRLPGRAIPALIEPEDDISPDALTLAQWEINTQREPIPEVDFAILVRDRYRAMFDHVRADRAGACEVLSIDPTGKEADSELAILLCVNEVLRLTGRPLQRRAVLQLAQCADKLVERTIQLARAYRVSQRSLSQLARLAPEEQVNAIERMTKPTVALETPKTRAARPTKPGRPTLAERELRLCNQLIDRFTQRTPKQLALLTPSDMHRLQQGVADAREALDAYAGMLSTLLKKTPGPLVPTGDKHG